VVAWAASLAMLPVLTGCGSDAEGTPETYDDGRAFAECMRAQGIDMPDPADEDALRDAMEAVMDQYDQATIGQAMSFCGELMPLQAPGH
jgi:hypothetical protein